MHKLPLARVHTVLLRLLLAIGLTTRKLRKHALAMGTLTAALGVSAGSDAAGAAVASASRALFVQGSNLRLSNGKRSNSTTGAYFLVSFTLSNSTPIFATSDIPI